MTRQELREKFRAENPEITDRVIGDATLNSWMETANEEVCCETRCIVTNETEVFDSSTAGAFYDLESNITNFHDIDDMPGGGVYYDDEPLVKASPGEMNYKKRTWKSAASGTPKYYWRRGKYLWLHPAPDDDDIEIGVDCILRPDAFDSEDEEPFSGLGHLQAYSDAINKYLQWRCKSKVGKGEEAMTAEKDFASYVAWMKKRVKGSKYGSIYIKPADR